MTLLGGGDILCMRRGLEGLPVEILYEVHLYAASPQFPHVSRRLYTTLRFAPPTIHARYILSVLDGKIEPASLLGDVFFTGCHDTFLETSWSANYGFGLGASEWAMAMAPNPIVPSITSLPPQWMNPSILPSVTVPPPPLGLPGPPPLPPISLPTSGISEAVTSPFSAFASGYYDPVFTTNPPLYPSNTYPYTGNHRPLWEDMPLMVTPDTILNFATSLPLCNQQVLEAVVRISGILKHTSFHRRTSSSSQIHRIYSSSGQVAAYIPSRAHGRLEDMSPIKLPKRPFRSLCKSPSDSSQRRSTLAYIQYIYTLASELGLKVRTNGDQGYSLIWAVEARDRPLVELLLENGADPDWQHALAIQIAISKKEFEIVKLLVEKMSPRCSVPLTPDQEVDVIGDLEMGDMLLARALRYNATEIAQWLATERGCSPNTHLLEMP